MIWAGESCRSSCDLLAICQWLLELPYLSPKLWPWRGLLPWRLIPAIMLQGKTEMRPYMQ